MSNQLFSKADDPVKGLFRNLGIIGEGLNKLKLSKTKSLLNDNYITDKELSALLKVSRRCLQEYRANGILPYYQICGKILYKESEIRQLLNDSYKKAFKKL